MKNLKNLGQALTKAEQKNIIGGKEYAPNCGQDSDCTHDGFPPVCDNGHIAICYRGTCQIAVC